MMAYKEWGDPHNSRVLVCVHGVTRVSDDFDHLAQALCKDYRVVCPDVVGRGRSSKLRDSRYYVVPQYVSDMVTLLARVNAESVDWLGTSMGGLIGMGLASLPDTPIRKLVLNDIGPALNFPALTRIAAYIGQDIRFDSFEQAVSYIQTIHATFGPHSDDEWRKLTADVMHQDHDGRWMRHYDLSLAVPFTMITEESAKQAEALSWAAYDAIGCPTLLTRGGESDLLSPEVAQAMTTRGPKAKLVEFPGIGHAPTFMHADQVEVIKEFLLG
jgi:pimeloyl-ACP methyl ester carboxylesterase